MEISALNYSVRMARAGELEQLRDIERAAGKLFAEIGLNEVAELDPLSLDFLESCHNAGLAWVAVDSNDWAVGFAVASELDGDLYLEEISVNPAHGRRGVGKLLIETLCGWALQHGYSAVTLLTFLDVPWNAPFYSRIGFRLLGDDELSPDLKRFYGEDVEFWSPLKRVCMKRDLRR